MAAGTGSLTVTGNDAFKSVDAYQMFVVEGSQADSAKYTLNSARNGFFTSTNLGGFPEGVTAEKLSDAAFTYIKGLGKDNTEKVNAFAKTAAAWAAEHLSESSAPTKVSTNADDGTNQATLPTLRSATTWSCRTPRAPRRTLIIRTAAPTRCSST